MTNSPPTITREAATHHGTPDSTWEYPGPAMFAPPPPQLVEIRGEYFQDIDTLLPCPVVGRTDTDTVSDMTLLTKASGKYQGPPTPIPTLTTALVLLSHIQPSPGRTHQHSGPHCISLGPSTAPTMKTDPMVKMMLQKM